MANKVKFDALFVENARQREIDATDNMTVQQLKDLVLKQLDGMPSAWTEGNEVRYFKCIEITELDKTVKLRPGETLIMVPTDRRRVRPITLQARALDGGQAGEYTIKDQHRVLVGRSNNQYQPEVDLSLLFAKTKDRTISRRQMVLEFMDGEWVAYKHRDARVPVFINGTMLAEDTPVRLREGTQIAIGVSVENPLVMLTVRLGA